MKFEFVRLRFAERLILPLFLLVCWAATASGDSVSVFRGADPGETSSPRAGATWEFAMARISPPAVWTTICTPSG